MGYIFFKTPLRKRCYWCGEDDRGKLSDDHLPPSSIFPEEERDGLQLITAAICDRCKEHHGRSGEDDNTFIWHMQLWASMRRGGKDISRNLGKCVKYSSSTKNQLIAQADYLDVELSNGQKVQHIILEDKRKTIAGVLDSIARGFYYRMRGKIVPQGVSPDFEFKPKGSFNSPVNLLAGMTPCVVKKDVFEFSPVLYEDDNFKYLCWEFKFYNLDPLPIYYSYYENVQEGCCAVDENNPQYKKEK